MAASNSKTACAYSMVKSDVQVELASLVKMNDNHLITLLGRKYLEIESGNDNRAKQHGKVLLWVIWYLKQTVHFMQMSRTTKVNLSMMKIPTYEMKLPPLVILFHVDHQLSDLDTSISYEVSEFKDDQMIMWAKVNIKEFKIKQWKPETLQKWVENHPQTPTTNLFSESGFSKAAKQLFSVRPGERKLKVLQEFQHLFRGKATQKARTPDGDMAELVKFAGPSHSTKP